jgi:hypothetical protein
MIPAHWGQGTMTTTLTAAVAPRAAIRTRRVFVPLALLAILMAAVGFWPGYFGPVLAGAKPKTLLVHFHAVIFVGWLAMFATQAALAATGRIALHMKLGPWLFLFGGVLIVTGILTTLGRFEADVASGNSALAARRLFAPLRDMAVFTPLLVVGWIYRRRPEAHKRIMLVATNVLLVAAVSRMQFLGTPPAPWIMLLLWPLPTYIAMVHDFVTKRLVHSAYVIGVFAMVAMQLVSPFRRTDTWIEFSTWLAAFYH